MVSKCDVVVIKRHRARTVLRASINTAPAKLHVYRAQLASTLQLKATMPKRIVCFVVRGSTRQRSGRRRRQRVSHAGQGSTSRLKATMPKRIVCFAGRGGTHQSLGRRRQQHVSNVGRASIQTLRAPIPVSFVPRANMLKRRPQGRACCVSAASTPRGWALPRWAPA